MSKKYFYLLVVFIFTCAPSNLGAQVNDAGLWTSINLEKKINSKVNLSLSEELRFYENVTEIGSIFTDIGGTYKFNKHIALSATYRITKRKLVDDFYSTRHRYMIDLSFKYKFKKIGFNFRERFQSQYEDINTSENGKIPTNYFRSKLTIKYNLEKKYTPYVSGELFYQLNNVKGNEIDNVRLIVGFEYNFNKRTSVDLYYLINKEINLNNPLTNYVIGVGFNYSL